MTERESMPGGIQGVESFSRAKVPPSPLANTAPRGRWKLWFSLAKVIFPILLLGPLSGRANPSHESSPEDSHDPSHKPSPSLSTCQLAIKRHEATSMERLKTLSPEEAWSETQRNFSAIQNLFVGDGLEPLFFSLMTGALAKEFVWINGGSGGAKTSISKTFYKNLLLGLPYEQKENFFIQFNKLMTEHVITGNPKINSMLKGRYDRNFEQSLVHESFRTFILDEIDKSHTGLQNSLLSLLAERAVMGGDKLVQAGIETGVITSNKTTGQLYLSYESDAPTAEALLDRMAMKSVAPNKQMDSYAKLEMYRRMQVQKLDQELPLPVAQLRDLVQRVEIPDALLRDFAQIANEFDPYTITKKESWSDALQDPFADVSPYFPANQFTNRSWRKILNVAKASFLTEQLMDGVPYKDLRFRMDRQDLNHFATTALYNGPGRIQSKFIKAKPFFIFVSLTDVKWFNVFWYPQKKLVLIKSTLGHNWMRFRINPDQESYTLQSYNLDQGHHIEDINQDHITNELNQILDEARKDPNNEPILAQPEGFAVDPVFADYLSLTNLSTATRMEVESIQNDHKTLVRILNNQLNKPYESEITLAQIKKDRLENLKMARANRQNFQSLLKNPESLNPANMWPITQATVKEILTTFPEMKHVIKSVILAMATDSNVFLFGPPGGAKTAIAKVMIDAELKTINKLGVTRFIQNFLKNYEMEHPEEFKLFILQCHQLLPEGQIIGFQNIDTQIENDGKLEWNTDDSLAGRTFLYAIIDETEKAPSAVATTMLSIMEDREVPYGAVTIPAGIIGLIFTSNKTPSEYLDSFDVKDLPTGLAMMDRASIKTYVPNKFGKEKILIEYLAKIESGLSPKIHGALAINYLKPLIERVRDLMLNGDAAHYIAPNETLPLLALDIAQIFDEKQIAYQESSEKAHRVEPFENPYYYVKATSGSNRSVESMLDLFSAAKIVDQLVDGVPFDKITYDLTYRDIGLIAWGQIYSGPYEFVPRTDADGFIYFDLDTETMDTLISSGRLDPRNVHILNSIKNEAETLKTLINDVLYPNQVAHREIIQRHPNLVEPWTATETKDSNTLEDSKRGTPQ